jgi:transcriptional regulator with XRE-family HTH domain
MDSKATIKEFLVSRRARLSPEDAGLPSFGANRRVAGLRREEVAMLAGVSADYYIRLERGNLDGASDSVLNAIARALQLDDVEIEYLFSLARSSAGTKSKTSKPATKALRANLQLVLDSIQTNPAFVRNGRMDLLGANALGRAVYSPILTSRIAESNMARWVFLDPAAVDYYVDYSRIAADSVGVLRLEAVRSADDPKFTQLLGELSAKSELFRQLWANHKVVRHYGGTKSFCHPQVGLLTMSYEPFSILADENLIMNVYSAEPGSDTAEKLQILGNWLASSADLQSQLSAAL